MGGVRLNQSITESHFKDAEGNPTGGTTSGVGISISWQNGPLGKGDSRKQPNGAFVEGVLAAALGRLKFYQASQFSCPENEAAIQHVEAALQWLTARTVKRAARGVEGTHEV